MLGRFPRGRARARGRMVCPCNGTGPMGSKQVVLGRLPHLLRELDCLIWWWEDSCMAKGSGGITLAMEGFPQGVHRQCRVCSHTAEGRVGRPLRWVLGLPHGGGWRWLFLVLSHIVGTGADELPLP